MIAVEEKVKDIAKPILDSLGYELIEVEYLAGRGRAQLRLFIDKKDGLTLDDCERVSRYIGYALDVEDPIPNSYILEVSSPGLDRLFRKPSDYERYKGRLIKIQTKLPIDNRKIFIGRLNGIIKEAVEIRLERENDILLTISLDNIKSARLEVEF